MILLIGGATHTGKTNLAQRLLESRHYPYLSIDHLKMGLIRSGYCPLTPEDSDESLTAYLWPIVREIIKTNIENRQNLIVEGCYIPFDYAAGFTESELAEIRYLCLIFSEDYIRRHYADILAFENVVEHRLSGDSCGSPAELIEENRRNLELCRLHGCPYCWIDGEYPAGFDSLWD